MVQYHIDLRHAFFLKDGFIKFHVDLNILKSRENIQLASEYSIIVEGFIYII